MTALAAFDAAFKRLPVIAILRGLRPDEAEGIAGALIEAALVDMKLRRRQLRVDAIDERRMGRARDHERGADEHDRDDRHAREQAAAERHRSYRSARSV